LTPPVGGRPGLRSALMAVAAASALALAQPSPAQRIVSLVPAVTEMLFALGAGPQVAGVSSYDREPPAVERLPRVGALLDPDLERILSLRPDLVVIYESQTELASQLARAGTPVFSYRHGGVAGITDTIRRLGAHTGHPEAADRLARAIGADLEMVRARVSGRPRPRVLLVLGRDPDVLRNVFVSGGVGFLHEVLEAAGGANVFEEARREGLQVSVEQILARRPDVILELRADGDPADDRAALRAWEAVASVPAVRNGRVRIMRGSELVVPGPRIARAAERFAREIHPAGR
jgi:iron complex transport system substrate-binding protein